MRDLEFFTLTKSDYFESLERYPIRSTYIDLVEELLPDGWETKRSEVWVMAHPKDWETIDQGFKIHLAATRLNAEEILRRAVPVCAEAGVAFKFVADPDLLSFVNSKNYSRVSSGKFLVAYPLTRDQFLALIEDLDSATRGLEGPYILTDRRYGDSRTVFYRYGGFRRIELLQIDGKRNACVRTPDGQLLSDERVPYFQLPEWVSDPFPAAEEGGDAGEPLNGRFRVEEALTFSNAGGVYRATDLTTGDEVILKEARPLTNFFWSGDGAPHVDATHILEKEYRILRKLEDLSSVPRAIDFFQAWEHSFLAEAFVPGVTLAQHRASDDFILIQYADEPGRVATFCRNFRQIAGSLIQMVSEIHERDVVIADLSPFNILVDTEASPPALKLIDFEGALDLANPGPGDRYASRMFTPGFRRRDRILIDRALPEDDSYALGMILYSLILPIQSFFALDSSAQQRFLEEIGRYVGLPEEVGKVIQGLLDGDFDRARSILDQWDVESSVRVTKQRRESRPEPPWEERRADLDRRIDEALEGIRRHLMSSFDVDRSDRLWPGDVDGFMTNPLNLACGAGGPLLLLQDLGQEIPQPVVRWLLDQKLSMDTYPPGLFLGLAGIAQVFAEIGLDDAAAATLEESNASPLIFQDASYLHGAAGWGLAHLWFFERTDEASHLERAVDAGERILEMAERRDEGLCWRNPVDELVHFGLGLGASGIALFFAHLWRASGEARFREACEEALRFELSMAEEPAAELLRWRNDEDGPDVYEPYWIHGSAGIASSLIRCYEILGEERYRDGAERAAEYAKTRFAVQPSQFQGLSGMGETALDLYRVTGETEYLRRAYDFAQSILLYAVERQDGILFPGRLLIRFSTDLSTGSAGVGLFLHRLRHLEPRRFHDLGSSGGTSARPDAARGLVACR